MVIGKALILIHEYIHAAKFQNLWKEALAVEGQNECARDIPYNLFIRR